VEKYGTTRQATDAQMTIYGTCMLDNTHTHTHIHPSMHARTHAPMHASTHMHTHMCTCTQNI